MRSDLTHLLYQEIESRLEFCFGSRIRSLADRGDTVEVTFKVERQEEFDLVVGSDGIHSDTRNLVFGDSVDFTHYLGYYVASFPVEFKHEFKNDFTMYLEPDRQASVYPIEQGVFQAALIFRAAEQGAIPAEDRKSFLERYYQDAGWHTLDLIESITPATPVFLDTVTQVTLPQWSQGRVVLVGGCRLLPHPHFRAGRFNGDGGRIYFGSRNRPRGGLRRCICTL